MQEYKDNFINSDFIKGLAIFAVICNHYLYSFVSVGFEGFALLAITLFFIASGYGIVKSLNKFQDFRKILTINTLLNFYFKRLLRVLPLYYFAVLLLAIIQGVSPGYQELLLVYSKVYWFIPAIIHCYLAAPFLYFLLKRFGLRNYLALIIIIFILLNAVLDLLPKVTFFSNTIWISVPFGYINLFGAHIFIFALAMTIPDLIKHAGKFSFLGNTAFVSIVFIFLLIITRLTAFPLKFITFPVYILSALAFALNLYTKKLRGLFVNAFALLGVYSLPLYLFHYFFFYAVEFRHTFPGGELRHLLFMIVFFPFFMILLILLQRIFDYIALQLYSRIKFPG